MQALYILLLFLYYIVSIFIFPEVYIECLLISSLLMLLIFLKKHIWCQGNFRKVLFLFFTNHEKPKEGTEDEENIDNIKWNSTIHIPSFNTCSCCCPVKHLSCFYSKCTCAQLSAHGFKEFLAQYLEAVENYCAFDKRNQVKVGGLCYTQNTPLMDRDWVQTFWAMWLEHCHFFF